MPKFPTKTGGSSSAWWSSFAFIVDEALLRLREDNQQKRGRINSKIRSRMQKHTKPSSVLSVKALPHPNFVFEILADSGPSRHTDISVLHLLPETALEPVFWNRVCANLMNQIDVASRASMTILSNEQYKTCLTTLQSLGQPAHEDRSAQVVLEIWISNPTENGIFEAFENFDMHLWNQRGERVEPVVEKDHVDSADISNALGKVVHCCYGFRMILDARKIWRSAHRHPSASYICTAIAHLYLFSS